MAALATPASSGLPLQGRSSYLSQLPVLLILHLSRSFTPPELRKGQSQLEGNRKRWDGYSIWFRIDLCGMIRIRCFIFLLRWHISYNWIQEDTPFVIDIVKAMEWAAPPKYFVIWVIYEATNEGPQVVLLRCRDGICHQRVCVCVCVCVCTLHAVRESVKLVIGGWYQILYIADWLWWVSA